MIYYLIVLVGILACSASQLLLKKSATMEHESVFKTILNWRVMLSYGIMFITLVMNIYALKNGVSLKDMPILEAAGYIFVPVLSYCFLSERISKRNVKAILFVLIGIVIFYS